MTDMRTALRVQNKSLELVCFAVMRHLVAACGRSTRHTTAQKFVFVFKVRKATEDMSASGRFRHLSDVERDEVRHWKSQLEIVYMQMEKVSPEGLF